MKKFRKYAVILILLSIVISYNTVHAEDEYEDEIYDESYYSEETYEEEYDEDYDYDYDDEYDTEEEEYDEEEESEYIEDESEYEEYEEEWNNEEESEYEESSEESEEYHEEPVSEVSIEESSEPIIKNTPLDWQKNMETVIPADISGYISPAEKTGEESSEESETHHSESTSLLPAEETVLNIADLAKPEDTHHSFVFGTVIWIVIGLVTGLLIVVFANIKGTEHFNRRRYYRSAKHITKRHIK